MTHLFLINIINATLSFYLFIIFAWWWAEKGHAPSLHSMICGVMFGMFLQYAVMASHSYRAICGEDFDDILRDSLFVSINKYFVMIPLICFAWYVTKRIFFDNSPFHNGD